MATLARLSRKALKLTPTTATLPLRSFSTASAAVQSYQQSTPPTKREIVESLEWVKWDYRGQRLTIPLGQWNPKIAVDAYVAPNVVLAGQVHVCDGSSVWNGSVLRGDLNKITLGFCSNVQEKCVLHAAWSSPTEKPSAWIFGIVNLMTIITTMLVPFESLEILLMIDGHMME